MTKKELSDLLGYKDNYNVNMALNKLPEIKSVVSKAFNVETNFTLEETLAICRAIVPTLSDIQLLLVESNYISHDTRYIDNNDYMADGQKKFNEMYKKSPKDHKACDSCIYIQARTVTTTDWTCKPFCTFYNRWLHIMKIEKWGNMVPLNIYVDRCPTYKAAKEPCIFWKKGHGSF